MVYEGEADVINLKISLFFICGHDGIRVSTQVHTVKEVLNIINKVAIFGWRI